jgi:hypothetical protein
LLFRLTDFYDLHSANYGTLGSAELSRDHPPRQAGRAKLQHRFLIVGRPTGGLSIGLKSVTQCALNA